MRLISILTVAIVGCGGDSGSGGGGGIGGGGGDADGGGGDGAPVAAGVEEGAAACSNGADDDGDGYIDCADRDCALTAPGACPGEAAASGGCSDGVDNDGDGFIDGSDDGCEENTAELCTDGLDNDGNGFIDCGDFGCSRNPDLDLDCPAENTDEQCQDGQDNDGNSYVDCDDFGCSRNPDVTVCGGVDGGGQDGGGQDGGDGGVDGGAGGGDGGGNDDPCSAQAPGGICADPAEVCQEGQCVARSDDFGVPAQAGDLLITEFLANVELEQVPNNEDTAEWFEVHNTLEKPVDLRGLTVSDDDTDSFVVGGPEPVRVEAGGFAVLGRSTDRAINGDVGVVYAYANQFTLANSGDEITLTLGALELDKVVYDGAWPHSAGVTSSRDATGLWCAGKAAWSETSGQKGSPGQENPSCG